MFLSFLQDEQFIYLKRLLIIFGSIGFLWLIIGFVFLSIQTYRHFKNRTKPKYILCHSSLQLPTSIHHRNHDEKSNSDFDDDQVSLSTSVSFISERMKYSREYRQLSSRFQQTPDESFELIFPSTSGLSNLAYNQSNLSCSSSSDIDTSLLYYPAHRNYAYSQSTLCSFDSNSYQKTPTPSLILPRYAYSPNRQVSTNTVPSQQTNSTYVSSTKSFPLPTVMITDVDRLQTDIIELDNFEPEKEWKYPKNQLRYFLNERILEENEC